MSDAAATPRREQRTHVRAIVLAVIALAAAVLAWTFDWNWFKGPLERRVSAITGHELSIDGDLDVDLGRVIVVRAERLRLANSDWSSVPEMARAELLRVEVPFRSLLRRAPTLNRIDLVRPALLLERKADGAANWARTQGTSAPVRRVRWTFGELRVHEGKLELHDAPLKTDLKLTIDSPTPAPNARNVRLDLRGDGRYRGHPFELEGWADSPVALLKGTNPAYEVDVTARAGATRARAYGGLRVPFDPDRFAVQVELRGDDLEDLYPLLGLALPSTPPYRVTGELERDGMVVRMRDVKGRVGDSDVRGAVSVDRSGRKPALYADLVSSHLDIDDLGGMIGLPPSAADGETASEEQRAAARARQANPRLLPDREYDLRKLASVDAKATLRAASIDAGKWPIEAMQAKLDLHDSVLKLQPLDVTFAGGRVAGTVQLDARQPHIVARADLDVRGVDLGKVWPDMQPRNAGHINGKFALHGRGNSVAQMLATADGTAQVGMGRGRFSNLLLELAGLDVAESLRFLLGKDKTVPLRCALGDFSVDDGRAKARTLVFDTTDTVIFGKGSLDFGHESLALELNPRPKDVSPISLRGPIEVDGTFKDPVFHPKAKPLLGRAAAAAALYAIAPPAALLALVETGPGDDVDCLAPGEHKKQKQAARDGEGKNEKSSDDDQAEQRKSRNPKTASF